MTGGRSLHKTVLTLAVLLALSAGACSDGPAPPAAAKPDTNCGIPSATDKRFDPASVPAAFSLDGEGEIERVVESTDGYTAVVALPRSIEGAYEGYRETLPRAGYDIVGEDFEGFEAELYLRHTAGNASLQLRKTTCADTVATSSPARAIVVAPTVIRSRSMNPSNVVAKRHGRIHPPQLSKLPQREVGRG